MVENSGFNPKKAVGTCMFCSNYKSKVRYASEIKLRYVTLVRYDIIPRFVVFIF